MAKVTLKPNTPQQYRMPKSVRSLIGRLIALLNQLMRETA